MYNCENHGLISLVELPVTTPSQDEYWPCGKSFLVTKLF